MAVVAAVTLCITVAVALAAVACTLHCLSYPHSYYYPLLANSSESVGQVSEAKCATTVWDMSLEADDEAKLDDTTGQPEVCKRLD